MKYLLVLFIFLSSIQSHSQNTPSINISEENSAVLSTYINNQTMIKLLQKLDKIDRELPANKPIYIIIDSNGGEVDPGMRFVRTIQKHPSRKFIPIVVNAASMAFFMIQYFDERLATPDATFMAHEVAYLVNGKLRLRNLIPMVEGLVQSNEMYEQTAKRLKMPLEKFMELIDEDYNFKTKHALKINAIDKVVNLKCSKTYELLYPNMCE